MTEKPMTQDFVQVPREPTNEMLEALNLGPLSPDDVGEWLEGYAAMIEAAPPLAAPAEQLIPRLENCGRYLARDNKGQWHYINHANTWQGFQGPESAPPAPSGWQPIETVPDGVDVEICSANGSRFIARWNPDCKWFERHEGGLRPQIIGAPRDGPFTHWAPLRPAPGDGRAVPDGVIENSASFGPGSHASHEDPKDLRPSGFDPIARQRGGLSL